MKKYILVFLILTTLSIFGQEQNSIEPIQTDRPDQTETPAIVPKGMFQVESGFSFEKGEDKTETFNLPSTLWKYGVNENFELRLITEFVIMKNEDEKDIGFNPVAVGCKIKLSEESGIFPKTSFIGHIGLPKVASKEFKADFYAPEFRFTMQHTLTDKMTLSYNLGAEWDGFTAEPTFIYTLTTGYALNNKWGSYIELFGFAPQNSEVAHNLDGGFTYLINKDTMIDFSAGLGLTQNSFQHYLALGFSFRK